MKKKFLSLVLALLLALGCLSELTLTARAYSTGDTYPAEYKSQPIDSIVDRWNFYNRECTSFVAWCLNDRNGVNFTNWYGGIQWGHAKNWGNAAANLGITVNGNPAVGSVAWSNAGTYGHVAWVTAVNGDYIQIEEYNYGYAGAFNSRSVHKSVFSGYIHIKDLGGSAPVEPSVTFGPWSKNGYTYIGKTDAAIGQLITVSNGNCSETGMYLYNANGQKVASGKNSSYEPAVPQIYFKINEECSYILTPGTTYKYKFYAVVNIKTYWSDMGSFKTDGQAPVTSYSLSLSRSSLSLAVGDKVTLSATVSPAGPAVTWKSSDESVAKVENGNVTAVKGGNATITAAAAGKTATCTVTVTASAAREREPNDTIVTANPVALNKAVTGSLYKTSDEDWFEFTLPGAGMVQLSFGHKYVNVDSACWRTYLYTKANKEIVFFSWKGNATATEQSGQIGLEAGTYYVCVKKSPAYRYDVDYQLTVNFNASNKWETEFNDTAAIADSMALNTAYYGSIMHSTDKDWYAFTLPADETVQLVFGNEPAKAFGANWRTTIYTNDQKKVISNTWRADATADRASDACDLAAGTYYVCVEGMIGNNRKEETYWVTVKTVADGKPGAGDIVAPFTDVKASAYYADAVKWAIENSVTSGIDNTHFGPNTACTRAQAVTFLWRASGSPEPQSADAGFTDVKAGDYYEKAVRWAVENGVTSGTGGGKFGPNSTCTRAQIVAFQYRAAGSPEIGNSSFFGDVASGAYYGEAVAWAVQNKITSGTGGGKFSPNDKCTRAQIVTFLYRQEG